MMIKHTHTLALGALLLGFLAVPLPAHAQDETEATPPPVDIIPAAGAKLDGFSYDASAHTHPPIKLTPDKSELVRLDEPAGSIIVGNPAHLSILTDTSQILVLIPRAPGATYFTILDRDGNVIMQRHAIVASPKEKYIRIRNSCAGSGDDECQETQVFYCPDMCHSILIGSGEQTSNRSQRNAGSGSAVPIIDVENINVTETENSAE